MFLQLIESFVYLETSVETIEECFKDFTTRRDISIVLINQHVKS